MDYFSHLVFYAGIQTDDTFIVSLLPYPLDQGCLPRRLIGLLFWASIECSTYAVPFYDLIEPKNEQYRQRLYWK